MLSKPRPENKKRAKFGEAKAFLQKCLREEVDADAACLIWPHNCDGGYPTIRLDGKNQRVQDLILEPISDKPKSYYSARPICGEKRCVRRKHLEWRVCHQRKVAYISDFVRNAQGLIHDEEWCDECVSWEFGLSGSQPVLRWEGKRGQRAQDVILAACYDRPFDEHIRYVAIPTCADPACCNPWHLEWTKGPAKKGDPLGFVYAAALEFNPDIDDFSDPCIIWPHSPDTDGYGHVKYEGKMWNAHRLALFIAVGPPPNDVDVLACHGPCNNPLCISPNHTYWGSYERNGGADMERDGTSNHKLTSKQEDAIKERYKRGGITQSKLAAEYDVSQRTIRNILKRKRRS